jgi:hypothetical protein
MAATPITVTRTTISGVNSPTPAAADTVNGNSVPNLDGLILTLENTGGSPATVTFATPVTHGGYAVADLQVTLAAAAKKNYSNFPAASFGRTVTFTASSADVDISAMAPAS